MIVIGALISAISCNLFLIPNHFLSGGLTGIAIILHYLFDLPIGIQNIIFNIPILYIAYHFFGRLYFFNTILGTGLYSFFIDLTSFLTPYTPLHNNPMLSAIVAGVVCGIGFGLILRANANTGGADVIAALIKKLYSYNIGTMIFALNCITNKKQIQHNIYCFGTISVTYGWAYLWKIFVSVFHYEFTI